MAQAYEFNSFKVKDANPLTTRIFSDRDNFIKNKIANWTPELGERQLRLMKKRTNAFTVHYFGSNERLFKRYSTKLSAYRTRMIKADKNCARREKKGYAGLGLGRKRRDDDYMETALRGASEQTERFFRNGVSGSPDEDFWTVQKYHARWVVNTFVESCPGMGDRILRKMDRMRLNMNYDYCDKIRKRFYTLLLTEESSVMKST